MIRVVDAVHVARIGKTTVRFFRPPSGRLDAPWVAVNDICNAARLSPDVKRAVLLKGGDVKTISASSGPVVVMSHEDAQRIIAATNNSVLRWSFDNAAKAANAKMLAGMSSGEIIDAFMRTVVLQ